MRHYPQNPATPDPNAAKLNSLAHRQLGLRRALTSWTAASGCSLFGIIVAGPATIIPNSEQPEAAVQLVSARRSPSWRWAKLLSFAAFGSGGAGVWGEGGMGGPDRKS